MSQNLISITITQEQQEAALAAIAQLEAALPGLISLGTAERKTLHHMGHKSEVFARGTIRVLSQNPSIVPPSMDIAGAHQDLAAFDRLRPIQEILSRVNAMVASTSAALGHDLMDFAFDGYSQLKVSGAAQGLEDLRRELGTRFSRRRREVDAGQ
ncbi:hypothetical protein [Agrilutibacter solisilvae]|uniref:Uncharacterized protein n=1 Tax=Agrilutibacter solisilvae TaxID=2763317 RepID=A0A975ARV3_9GAMM|nr:hypothetical protein [Lysobacter solisilvae]QSX77409.1 hypothetical protein I8J32_011635 [Lysobacter solisilvae]